MLAESMEWALSEVRQEGVKSISVAWLMEDGRIHRATCNPTGTATRGDSLTLIAHALCGEVAETVIVAGTPIDETLEAHLAEIGEQARRGIVETLLNVQIGGGSPDGS